MIKVPMYDSRTKTTVIEQLRWRVRKFKPMSGPQHKWLHDRGIEIRFEATREESFLLLEENDAVAFFLVFPDALQEYKYPLHAGDDNED